MSAAAKWAMVGVHFLAAKQTEFTRVGEGGLDGGVTNFTLARTSPDVPLGAHMLVAAAARIWARAIELAYYVFDVASETDRYIPLRILENTIKADYFCVGIRSYERLPRGSHHYLHPA